MCKKSKSKSSNKWQNFVLRMKLLWLWFLKNLSLFIKIAIIIIAILTATNVIGSENFIVELLGFSELEQIKWNSVHGIESAIAVVISAIITALMLVKKSKHLAIEDIKSRDLKIALIKARLYFNEDGKLCKRAEELTDLDLNNDDKIGDIQIKDNDSELILQGVGNAVSELATILTADLSDDEEIVEEEELHEKIHETESSIGLSDDEGTTIQETPKVSEEEKEETHSEPVELSDKEKKKAEKQAKREAKRAERAAKRANKKPNIFTKLWETFISKCSGFFKNLKNSILSMKDPKLDDGMNCKKKEKKIKEKHKKKEKTTKIEIVDTESEKTDLVEEQKPISENVENTEIVHKDDIKEELHEKQESKPLNRTETKKQEIDDILKGLK